MNTTMNTVRVLTDEERTCFDRDGFLVLRKVLDRGKIDALVTAGDALFASGALENRDTSSDGWDGYRNCLPRDPAFRGLLTNPATFPVVSQLIGPNIHLISSQLIYMASHAPGAKRSIRVPERHGWHRDLYGVTQDLGYRGVPRLALKVGFYLTDCPDPSYGMTLFAPGSHKLQEPLSIPPGAIDPPGAAQPKMEAGDAVIFENRLWHAGGLNHSGVTRKVVMLQYAFRWIKAVDYVPQELSAPDDYSETERQLLGLRDMDADGRFVAGAGAAPVSAFMKAHALQCQQAGL